MFPFILYRALFPCGDHMVCIIDDREDVWSYAPNLVVVKPYKVFKGSDDINDPFKPELTLTDSDGKAGDEDGVTINGKQVSSEEGASDTSSDKTAGNSSSEGDGDKSKVGEGEMLNGKTANKAEGSSTKSIVKPGGKQINRKLSNPFVTFWTRPRVL